TADETGGVSEAVAEAVRVVRESGLPCETNAMFTNVEGEWDEVMAVVKRAVDVVAAKSPRVGLVLKADIRPGYTGQLTAKVERVEQALSRHQSSHGLRGSLLHHRRPAAGARPDRRRPRVGTRPWRRPAARVRPARHCGGGDHRDRVGLR